MVGTLVRGYRCTMSWCDLDLTFDLALVTSSSKNLSGLCLRNNNNSRIYLDILFEKKKKKKKKDLYSAKLIQIL